MATLGRSRHRQLRGGDPPASDAFWDLVATARRLQGPGGCPWDRAQTVRTLLPHLVEEVWEVFCAERAAQRAELEEELGDVLYTVLFLTFLAERRGWLTLEELLIKTRHKMIRRHPHVFGTKTARSADEASAHWQTVKRREGRRRVSSSNVMRPLLVELFEALRIRPNARASLQRLLGTLRRSTANGTPRPSNATRAQRSSRSPSRG